MGAAAPYLAAGGTALSIGAPIIGGIQKNKMARLEAKQLEQSGTAALAQGTQQAQSVREQGDRFLSGARTAMAASGGTTTDPQALEDLGKISERVDYNVLAALFEGRSRQSGLQYQAKMTRYGGRMAKRMGWLKGGATALSAASGAVKGGAGGGGFAGALQGFGGGAP